MTTLDGQAHPRDNPFDGWKANLLSVEEVDGTWVNPPDSAPEIQTLAQPRGTTPTYLTGGKGSGKTHLMRWLSFPVQKRRAGAGSVLDVVQHAGYVGVWVLLGGFTASRFTGKGLTEEEWRGYYTYTFDLWLARATLNTYHDFLGVDKGYGGAERALCARVVDLFDEWPGSTPDDVTELLHRLKGIQKEVDLAVNNRGVESGWRDGPPKIRATSPALPFGIPQALIDTVPSLEGVKTLYLLDELENLPKPHQRYINTLVREQAGPTSIKIGTRLYGRLTFQTYSGEDNRAGSEFAELNLDTFLAVDRPAEYAQFCREVVARRLLEWEGLESDPDAVESRAARLDSDFEDPAATLGQRINEALDRRREAPYFEKLRRHMRDYSAVVRELGVAEDAHEKLVEHLRAPGDPVLEKANVLLIYRAWSDGRHLEERAQSIAEQTTRFRERPTDTEQHKVLRYFRADLTAQLLQELQLRQPYEGLGTLIDLSGGLPRYLLVILKHAYQTAAGFHGEKPFENGPISVEVQAGAVREGVRVFREDALPPEDLGQAAFGAVERLANLFRAMRFAEKPAESSLRMFTADFSGATSTAREVLEVATNWSLLRPIHSDRADRNTGDRERAFQLHQMLSPQYALPLARRGTIEFTSAEVNALFDPAHLDEYDAVRERRLERLTVPFGRRPGRLPGL